MAPESARMGEGVESSSDSSSSESSDSNVANGFGWEKREVRQGWMTVWGRGNVV